MKRSDLFFTLSYLFQFLFYIILFHFLLIHLVINLVHLTLEFLACSKKTNKQANEQTNNFFPTAGPEVAAFIYFFFMNFFTRPSSQGPVM